METKSPEIARAPAPDVQSMANERTVSLELAIANLTRLLARTDDPDTAAALVTERAAMRRELESARQVSAGNVVPFGPRRGSP